MPNDYSITATFTSAAVATQEAAALQQLFRAHAKQAAKHQSPTPSMLAYGARVGRKWKEPLTWGDEGLAGDEPVVTTLAGAVFVFHDYWDRPLELPAVLKAAGAKTTTLVAGPPILRVELTFKPGAAGTKLRAALAAMFAQREEPHLCDWKPPAWSTARRFLGESEDVWVVGDDTGCKFTFPVAPHDLKAFRAFLAAGARSLVIEPAVARDIAALQRAELASAAKAVPASVVVAKATAPIPKQLPKVQRISKGNDKFTPNHLASEAGALWATGHAGLHKVDPKKGAAKGIDVGTCRLGLCLHEQMVWVAGYHGVRQTADGGKRFTKLAVPDHKEGAPMLNAIARDADGVLWVGGYQGRLLACRDRKQFVLVPFASKSHIVRLRTTPYGVVVMTFHGDLGLIQNGKCRKVPVRSPVGLDDACVTPAGTLIVVGGRNDKGIVLRSTNGGQTFTAGKTPAALYTVASLADGRVIAGGDEALYGSLDDGKTFARLAYSATKGRAFCAAIEHEGAVYVGGPWQDLVRVS